MKRICNHLPIILLLGGCAVQPDTYSPTTVPPAPDYAKNESWAALPQRHDNADRTPDSGMRDEQDGAQADVFFLHPTIYWDKSARPWNASIDDQRLNEKADKTTILFQASAFNSAGRVFAPRYRQAHIRSFRSKDKQSARQALDLAYEDIRTAFAYYLAHYNQGRPIILAAHSQGALHGYRLVEELFEGQPLRQQLVVAYLVGWPVLKNGLKTIGYCKTPEETGCICSWRSFKYGYTPGNYLLGDSIVVTNPLTWSEAAPAAPKSANEGMLARKFGKLYPGRADASAVNGMLWVHKPRFPGSLFFTRRNYHIADYNLFYVNIRNNARRRVEAFWK
jgi:hypothetical protein